MIIYYFHISVVIKSLKTLLILLKSVLPSTVDIKLGTRDVDIEPATDGCREHITAGIFWVFCCDVYYLL